MRYHVYQFSDKMDNFEFLGPNLPKNGFLGSKFQKSKSGFGFSILEILCAPIFRQSGELWIFGPKFAQKWILGLQFQKSKSGFEINTSIIPCVSLFSQNGEILIFQPKFEEIVQLRAIFFCPNIVEGVAESWVEQGGGGWSWVKLGARFSNTHLILTLPPHAFHKVVLRSS